MFALPQVTNGKNNILKYVQLWVERTRDVAVLLQWDTVAGKTQTSGEAPEGQLGWSISRWLGMLLVAGCPIRKNWMVAIHHLLRFVRQMQALWASHFGVVAIAVVPTTDKLASVWLGAVVPTTDKLASVWLGDFAAAAAALNLGDVRRVRR